MKWKSEKENEQTLDNHSDYGCYNITVLLNYALICHVVYDCVLRDRNHEAVYALVNLIK